MSEDRTLSTGDKTGEEIIEYAYVKCASCGGDILSTDNNCPNCGATRKVDYKIDEIQLTGKEITDKEDLAKPQQGAKTCPYCGKLGWNYNEAKRKYTCDACGAGTGTKSDFELGGGQVDPPEPVHQSYVPEPMPLPQQPNKLLFAGLVGGGILLIIFLIWLFTGFNTSDVKGYVNSVSWTRTAHMEENHVLSGEGWNLPALATVVSSPTKISGYKDNVTGYKTIPMSITSTPHVIGHTHSMIKVETPGAIYTTEPYKCGGPTPRAGGSVAYAKCSDKKQKPSTYGEEESPPTPVYAARVNVQITSQPTPIYGTPTPIYKTYYFYTYWKWEKTGDLDQTTGNTNDAYWPSAQTDEFHRVVNDTQHYVVVLKFDNGESKTIESDDPEVLNKYMLKMNVVGKFNRYGLSGIVP